MISSYLLINIFIVLFPLLFIFEKRLAFYKKIKHYAFSVLTVGSFFIVWDIFVTWRGDWAFSPLHVMDYKFFTIPFEELLFFITVPYSCLFTYEAIKYLVKEKKIRLPIETYYVAAVLMALAAIIINREYTSLVLLIASGSAILISRSSLAQSNVFWIFMVIGFGLFFIFNYILTSIPIVIYNPAAITNFRILTIPIEDFFYNFSLLGLFVLAYEHSKRWYK